MQWAVYKRQGTEPARPCEVGEARAADKQQWQAGGFASFRDPQRQRAAFEDHELLPCEAGQFITKETRPGGRALLRRVWEKQGHLTPAQAADTAYFLSLRPDPPEALLQQLTAYVLSKNPERSLSILGLHRHATPWLSILAMASFESHEFCLPG